MPPIERKVEAVERDVTEIKSHLGKLDRDVTDIKSHLINLDRDVGGISDSVKRLDERLLPVPWKWVVGTATLVSGIVVWVVLHYVNSVLPTQIANQVQTQMITMASSGNSPNAEFNRKLDEGLNGINKRLDEGLKGVDDRIDKLYERLAGTPPRLRSSLERALPKKPDEAKAGFFVTRELLAHARQKHVTLKPEELKSLALPLLDTRYGDSMQGEAWATVKEFATYRTLVNKVQFGVPKPQGAQPENYFTGGEHNLGSRSEWKDTVFVNCQINIKEAQANLILDNVRFINCDFLPLEETNPAKSLVAAVLSSDGPAVSAQLLNQRVPEGKPGS